jgi:hypothetical protein
MESFKGQEEEIKRAEEQYKKSTSPVFGRVSTTQSILKLQAVADRIKGRTTPRLQSKTKSVSSGMLTSTMITRVVMMESLSQKPPPVRVPSTIHPLK